MSRCAIITGISGQDGSYLTELLLSKNYVIFGLVRRTSSDTCREKIAHHENNPNIKLIYGDLTDISSIQTILSQAINHKSFITSTHHLEIYNLAAQSHVKVSFETPIYTANSDALGTLYILEAIRQLDPSLQSRVKFYQASTSEMFGSSPAPQNESTPLHPCSPYGVAKLYAHWITINYRESYNLWACSGILFNHESERRCKNFVTRKITCAVANYKTAPTKYKPLQLGNIEAIRDWGYSPDYVYGIWLIMQQQKPKEYVLATGKSYTIREFIELAFKNIDISIVWRGSSENEKGYNAANNELLVEINPKYYRPTEVNVLQGNSDVAREELQWAPSITFEEMVTRMVNNDILNTV